MCSESRFMTLSARLVSSIGPRELMYQIRMQMHHHAPAPSWLPPPTYHPIFHRVKEVIPVHVESGFGTGPVGVGGVGGGGCRSAPVSPSSPVSPMYGTLATSASVSAQGQGGRDGYFEQRGVGADTPSDNDEVGGQVGEVVWEKRFVKCSYAMVRPFTPFLRPVGVGRLLRWVPLEGSCMGWGTVNPVITAA